MIDRVTREVCPTCPHPCCRGHYCRETIRNPWYALVRSEAAQPPFPPEYARRRDPFGLGSGGCEIRAGRYVFCYSFNCRRLLRSFASAQRVAAFQEISDLLLGVNRLPDGRLLHELRVAALDERALEHLTRALDNGWQRLAQLAQLCPPLTEPTPARPAAQGDETRR